MIVSKHNLLILLYWTLKTEWTLYNHKRKKVIKSTVLIHKQPYNVLKLRLLITNEKPQVQIEIRHESAVKRGKQVHIYSDVIMKPCNQMAWIDLFTTKKGKQHDDSLWNLQMCCSICILLFLFLFICLFDDKNNFQKVLNLCKQIEITHF